LFTYSYYMHTAGEFKDFAPDSVFYIYERSHDSNRVRAAPMLLFYCK